MMAYSSSGGVDDSNTTVDYYSATTTPALHPNVNVIDGRLSSTYSIHLGLRKRDAVALFICLLLLRLAFAPNHIVGSSGEFVSHSRVDASMILVFYYPFQSNAAAIADHERKYSEEDGNEAWRRRTAQPAPLDIDGDGAFDSLAMPVFLTRENVRQEEELELTEMRSRRHHRKTATATNQELHFKRSSEWSEDGSWGLRILDLRPLHHSYHHENNDGAMVAYDGPFAPRTLFLTPLLPPSQHSGTGEDTSSQTQSQQQSDMTTTISKAYPIKLLSIQIPIQRTHLGEEEKSRQRHKSGSYGKNPNIPSKEDPLHRDYDRTRHYFCGSTWHHASQSCHRHCGGGLSSECGEGETCYADTPVS